MILGVILEVVVDQEVGRVGPTVRRVAPVVWSLVLAALVLGPALGPGFVLSRDMVWVPDLALRPDFLGLGTALPRAVPSDAVVAVLDEVTGGQLLQKLVLLGSLVGGGLGMLRLLPGDALVGRLVVVTVYQWNPFVAERLLLGHWPVLLGYAVLPWVVDAARRWRTSGAVPPELFWLLPLGSLSASAGLVTAFALLALAVSSRSWRRLGGVLALALVANGPWLVAGLLHAGAATTDPLAARLFALHGEGSVPAPLAALGLGGAWTPEVVPPSHQGALGWVALVVLGALVALGVRGWAREQDRRDRVGLLVCWGVGWGFAVLTWALPGATGWVFGHVPGTAVLRDGARTLALCAPLVALLAARGAATAVRSVPAPARGGLGLAVVLVPVMVLPDAAFGLSGELSAVAYPADWDRARQVVDSRAAAGVAGDVLVLPLTSYRRPAWNDDHKVLDPMGRLLAPDYVASDDLVLTGGVVRGEDPRVRLARQALAAGTVGERRRLLSGLGIGFVVTELDVAGDPAPALGPPVLSTSTVVVTQLAGARSRDVPPAWYAAAGLAFLAFTGSVLGGAAAGLLRLRARRGARGPGAR